MGHGDGAGEGFKSETLQMRCIVCNIIYSIFLLVCMMVSAIGVATYQWIEATRDDMEELAKIEIPPNAPGLNKVSCGLLTYCIDAAGEVAECTMPWPRYGGNTGRPKWNESPILIWNWAALAISIAIVLMFFPWLYTMVECFGFFSTKWHRRCNCAVTVAGLFLVLGIILFFCGWDKLRVEDCIQYNVDGSCDLYDPVFPSEIIEGGTENIGCRICANNMANFQLSSSCTMGWGSQVVLAAFVINIIASCIGGCIHSRPPSSNKIFPY